MRGRLVVAVAREAGGDQRVVVRPDRSGVVAERVVAGLARAERADAPAGVELLVEQPLGGGGCLGVVEDARPEQVADVGGQAVDLPFVAVERERVAAAFGHPEVAAEALPAGRRRAARGGRRAPSSPQTSRARRAARRCAS